MNLGATSQLKLFSLLRLQHAADNRSYCQADKKGPPVFVKK
jgi:hypothetical protein